MKINKKKIIKVINKNSNLPYYQIRKIGNRKSFLTKTGFKTKEKLTTQDYIDLHLLPNK